MALVLRKAVLPKNVSLLKCWKGRPLATASNKKTAAPLLHNAVKRSLNKLAQSIAVTLRSNQIEIGNRKDVVKSKRSQYRSLSCPCLSSITTEHPIYIHRIPSAVGFNKAKLHFRRQRFVPKMLINFVQRRAASTAPNVLNDVCNVCASPCPCPCAPCGCNCLPPPCNTPAKCLQYMTGYYYYPYGTWFCGPYHVSTGACGPCAGPIKPGGACGPTPPCPGGPCGPSCIGPCGPCGPLSCCGVCGIVEPFNCYATGSPYDYSSAFSSMSAYGPHLYGQITPNQFMQQHCYTPFNPYTNYNQFGQFNSMPAPHFGPCYVMPMSTPIPVNNPFVPMQGTFEPDPPYMPSPSLPTISNPQSFTYSRPTIRDVPSSEVMRTSPSLEGPCPKNLSPKSLRMSPNSRYETCMNKSGRPPKVVSRFIKDPKSILACYYSTKSIQKQSTNDIKTFDSTSGINRSNSFKMLHENKCKESCNRPNCYWCLESGRYAKNKGQKENIVTAQRKFNTTYTGNTENHPNKIEDNFKSGSRSKYFSS